MSSLAITQVKSGIGAPEKVRRTLKALGLRHQRTVVRPDHPAVRGMVFHVRHLVRVEEVAGGAVEKPPRAGRAKASKRSKRKTTTKRSGS